jgi:putative membrane protein
MNRCAFIAVFALSLCACRSHDRSDERRSESPSSGMSQPSSASLTSAERNFAEKALRGGQFEVETSRLALQKASSGQLRDFANMMITDHGQANRDLESLARRKGIYAPTTLDAEHQAKLDELRRLDGPQFDEEYRKMQIEAHDAAIQLFERASQECRDTDLRTFASQTLPTLQKHRSHLDEVSVATSAGG